MFKVLGLLFVVVVIACSSSDPALDTPIEMVFRDGRTRTDLPIGAVGMSMACAFQGPKVSERDQARFLAGDLEVRDLDIPEAPTPRDLIEGVYPWEPNYETFGRFLMKLIEDTEEHPMRELEHRILRRLEACLAAPRSRP